MVMTTPRDSPDAPAPDGGYVQSVEVRNAARTLYVSGQIPVAADGSVPSGFVEQARLVWRNVEAQLQVAGMSLDDICKVTIFLSDRRYALENRQVREEVLGSHRVALTVIITGIFDPAWLLEIEAIAAA